MSTATTMEGALTTFWMTASWSTTLALQTLAQVMVWYDDSNSDFDDSGLQNRYQSHINTGLEPFSTYAVRDIEKGEEVRKNKQVSTNF